MTIRSKPLYWRRERPLPAFDIVKLRPKNLSRGQRFETPRDVRKESVRSEGTLAAHQPGNVYSTYLRDCSDGAYACEKTYCPRCARTHRRFLIGELLRLNSELKAKARILVILLDKSPKGQIADLGLIDYRHLLRKRLNRAGLADVPVIGGFEIVYRARERKWVLHINMVIFGGKKAAIQKFAKGFSGDRAVRQDPLNDPIDQLSYVLKFTTYHRPHEQRGPKKAKAVPLNPREHFELVEWMAQYSFTDHLFLFNARRRGASIELSGKVARKA